MDKELVNKVRISYMSKLKEECGVFGIYSETTCDLASDVYCGLFALQHRGQDELRHGDQR